MNNRGVLHIPLLLALITISVAGFGIWGFLRQWRGLMELQVKIDRCVGETALTARDLLRGIDTDNSEITALRVSIAAATENPAAAAPLKAALHVVFSHQELLRTRWSLESVHWLVKPGCSGSKDIKTPMPELPVYRTPPDLIGEQVLSWRSGSSHEFRLLQHHRPRAAAAEIKENNHVWEAQWSDPMGSSLGPSHR